MKEVSIVGLDLAKRVFQAHGAGADGSIVFRKKLSRGQVLTFFTGLPKCIVAMEACATAHYWAREIGKLGHQVRLLPPAYVKPFVNGRRMMRQTLKQSSKPPADLRCGSSCRRPKASRPAR